MMHALLVALVVLAAPILVKAQAPLDACPADSDFKSLPFLKAAQPGAILSLVANGFNKTDMFAVRAYAQDTLVPMVGANVLFFALGLLFLVAFVLWRLLRFCFYMVCCQSSCDAKRALRNPYPLLFGRGTKIIKVFMCLFGLVSISFAIYGMTSLKQNVAIEAFGVLHNISNYTVHATDAVNKLVATLGGVNQVINSFQDIIVNDLEIESLQHNLTDVGDFWGSNVPANLRASVTELQTAYDTTFKARLAALKTAITVFTTADKPAMDAHCTVLEQAQSHLWAMQDDLTAVQDSLTGIPDWSSTTQPPLPSMQAVLTAVNDADYSNWVTWIHSVLTALDFMANLQTPANNPFSKLWGAVADVMKSVTTVSSRIDAMRAQLTLLSSKLSGIEASTEIVLTKLEHVNATIMAFTTSMQATYDSLTTASNDMMGVSSAVSSLLPHETSLANFAADMPATTPLVNLSAALHEAVPALNRVPYGATLGDAYVTWMTGLKTHATALTAAMTDFQAAATAYVGTQSAPNWDALHTGSGGKYTALKNALDAVWIPTPAAGDLASTLLTDTAAVPGSMTNFSSQSAWVKDAGVTVATKTADAVTYADDVIALPLPSVSSLATTLDTLETTFASFGAPGSTALNGTLAELSALDMSGFLESRWLEADINNTMDAASYSSSHLKRLVVGKLDNVTKRFEPLAQKADSYRYPASVGLYGVSILLVLLLLLSAGLNYHFGTNFSTLWLLLVTVLYLLLALVIALLVSLTYLGCGEAEPLLVKLSETAWYAPLTNYYFSNTSSTIQQALNASHIVDTDRLMDRVNRVLTDMPGNFTYSINTTLTTLNTDINDLLGKASREQLLPVYSEAKGLVCCMMPDAFASMWMGLTFAGVFALALSVCTFFYIGNIDKTPRKDCCGCTCNTLRKYEGTVFPDTLPQYNQPFPNPLGPYHDEVAAHVVLQAPGTAALKKE